MDGRRGSFPTGLIGISILAAMVNGACTYRTRTLKRIEEIKFKDGDYDVVVDPDSRGGDQTPACPEGFTGPTCQTCDTGYVPYQGDKCLPSCNSTTPCGAHGECGVLPGDDQICICDAGWDGEDCDVCADQWLPYNDDCIESCAISSLYCGHGTCEQDPLPLYCACDLGYGEPHCQDCTDGYVKTDAGQCVQTCESIGWQNCGKEASCFVDTSSGNVNCECLPDYQVYQDENADLICIPTCEAVDLSCWSMVDGAGRGSCAIIDGAPRCNCNAGYQDEDQNGTCEPDCRNAAGEDFCSNATACTLTAPYGGALCACNQDTQDRDGNGSCEPDCGSRDCAAEIGDDESWDFVGCRYDESGAQICRHVIYINKDNSSSSDGKTWGTAFPSFEAAADTMAAAGTTWTQGFDIWVSEGTYEIAAPVSLTANVHLYGGFPEDGTPTFEERDPDAFKTILDGNGATGVVLLATGDGIRLEGVTVMGGDNLMGPSPQGGGLRALSAHGLTVVDCNFFYNSAVEGAGVYLEDSANATFIDVVWFGNQATEEGGALRVIGGGITLLSSLAIGNNAADFGGGLSASNAEITLKDSLFTFNTANSGGAAHITGGQVTIDRLEVISNSGDGGAVVLEDVGDATIKNALFLTNGNATSGISGALKIDGPGAGSNEIHIQNTTFVDNSAGPTGSHSVSVTERSVRLFNIIAWGKNDAGQLKVQDGLLDVSYALVKGGLCGACEGDVQDVAPIFSAFEAPHNGTTVLNGEIFVHAVVTPQTLAPNSLAGQFILPNKDLASKRWSYIIGNSDHEIAFLGEANLDVSDATMLVSGFGLTVDSPGVDAGDGDHAPGWDLRRNPRHDVLGLANTGQGRPAFVDLGCFETQTP